MIWPWLTLALPVVFWAGHRLYHRGILGFWMTEKAWQRQWDRMGD